MKKFIQYQFIVFLFIGLLFLTVSCSKNDDNSEPVNVAVYNTMKEWYLWYSHIPEVDPMQYKSPSELLEAVKYKQLDRWSFITTTDEYQKYFVEGKYYGHGFGYGFSSNDSVRVSFIFKNAALYKAGVRRGWIIKKINGTIVNAQNISSLLGENKAGIINTFVFGRPNASDTTIEDTKTEVKMEMVLKDTIYQIGSKKVAYLVLYSFIADAKSEIEKAFNRYKFENINELVLDLRYNTGGYVEMGLDLASYIAGKSFENQVWCRFIHNNKKSDLDTGYVLTSKYVSISLSRLFVITYSATASTSEIIINGLRPLMPVITIGQKTNGKPVGMYIFDLSKYHYMFFPVSYEIVNKNNEGGYYNGIPVDQPAKDDLQFNFGDVREECLKQALNYIESGHFIPQRKTTIPSSTEFLRGTNWWDREFGAY